MVPDSSAQLVPIETILQAIVVLRDQRVMVDRDLATLYDVETGALNRAVKRNQERFPADFMFQLTENKEDFLRCQIGISNAHRGGRRYRAYAFTQEGIAMLSSVLTSKRAIQVNIKIMRAFIRMRQLVSSNEVLATKLEELERKVASHDQAIVGIFKALHELMNPPRTNAIGFLAIPDKHSR